MSSAVISFRLAGERLERLRRAARATNRTPGGLAAALVEEGLRLREYPGIEFRDTAIGRQAYLRGTRLALWQVALARRDVGADVAALAAHFGIDAPIIAVALAYIDAYRPDIEAAIADNEAAGQRLARRLPPDQVVDI
jgi:uncharacterized protein (DUF433 family)